MCVLWLLSEALIVDTCSMQREAGGHEDMMDAGEFRNHLLSVSQPLKDQFQVFFLWRATLSSSGGISLHELICAPAENCSDLTKELS